MKSLVGAEASGNVAEQIGTIEGKAALLIVNAALTDGGERDGLDSDRVVRVMLLGSVGMVAVDPIGQADSQVKRYSKRHKNNLWSIMLTTGLHMTNLGNTKEHRPE